MVTAQEILSGYLKPYLKAGFGYYRGMICFLLEKKGYSFESIAEWLNHPDVMKWDETFIMGQAMQVLGDIHDERLHDTTCSILRLK